MMEEHSTLHRLYKQGAVRWAGKSEKLPSASNK